MNFTELFRVKPDFTCFIFPVVNYCNLHCEWCSTLSHIPIRKDSPYPTRRSKWEASTKKIRLFCECFKSHGEDDIHRLTGAEPTCMPVKKLEAIIDVFKSYDRRLWMITNGYNLMGLSREYINKFSGLTLDDHGINHDHINACRKYLDRFYKGYVEVIVEEKHWNLVEAMRHPSNKGKHCQAMMRTPAVVDSIIYPCGNLFNIGQINRDIRIREELLKAGWTLENPKIIQKLRNWKQTIPRYVLDQCLNSSWRPNWKVGESVNITLKPNDVISKPTGSSSFQYTAGVAVHSGSRGLKYP